MSEINYNPNCIKCFGSGVWRIGSQATRPCDCYYIVETNLFEEDKIFEVTLKKDDDKYSFITMAFGFDEAAAKALDKAKKGYYVVNIEVIAANDPESRKNVAI